MGGAERAVLCKKFFCGEEARDRLCRRKKDRGLGGEIFAKCRKKDSPPRKYKESRRRKDFSECKKESFRGKETASIAASFAHRKSLIFSLCACYNNQRHTGEIYRSNHRRRRKAPTERKIPAAAVYAS